MACPNNLPMPQVLPAMLKLLPLKTDMTENETIYTCLLGLVQMNHPDAVAQKPELKRIFTEAVAPTSKVEDEVKAKLNEVLPALQYMLIPSCDGCGNDDDGSSSDNSSNGHCDGNNNGNGRNGAKSEQCILRPPVLDSWLQHQSLLSSACVDN
eukprot:CAMPEP_0198120454 /NCGR_PEP_ID=MMETSP1442-20131203/29101_1 /TAXON_ID= /ORGANISM="Craspedostauros australis, Strain CCMP3328" /LENGTH=152 /DNA_ID=CAMNT_0043779107 /DNA_START=10 /DNA_END=469 /DNA_ORIENTATION=+